MTGDGYRRALQHRGFRRLLGATLIDASGTWAYGIVLQVYVFDRTHSTLLLAVIPAARWLTGSVVGPFAGVLADRVDRVRLLTVSAAANAVVLSGIALVVATNAPVALLPVLSALVAVFASPVEPAAGALLTEVVDERSLGSANGLLAAVDNVTVVIGPAVGGLLLLTGRPTIGVAVDALSFAAAGLLAARIPARSRGAGAADGGALHQLRAGAAAITPTAAVLIGVLALDTAIYGASAVLYVPLSRHLGTGSDGASYLLAASAAGGVLGAGVAARFERLTRLAPVLVAGLLLEAAPFAVTAATTTPAVAAVLQLLSGVGMVVVDVVALTALQRDVARGYLGRVLALMGAAVTLGAVAAGFVGTAAFAGLGLSGALLVVGLVLPALGVAGLPLLRRADRAAAATLAAVGPTADALAALDLFQGITRAGVEALVEGAARRQLPAGAVLIREGEPAAELFVLLAGRLEVTTAHEGRRPDVLAPAYVGEIGLLRGVPRTATVVAGTDVEVLAVAKDDFVAAAETTPPSRSMLELAGARAG